MEERNKNLVVLKLNGLLCLFIGIVIVMCGNIGVVFGMMYLFL